MRIDINLNQKSVSKAIEQLEDYRDSLAIKNEDFVYELLRLGITVAEEKVVRFNPETNEKEGYGKYITFSKKGKGGIKTIGYLVGKDTQKIVAEWQYYDDKKTAVLSPILLAEFGSATYAEVLFDVAGVGQGTFPGQTHAFEDSWWYKEWDDNGKGEWRRAHGVTPTHPMYFAMMKMYEQVYNVARKVFRTDGR